MAPVFVEVVCDDTPSSMGSYTYRVPETLEVKLGDAVTVPLGRSKRHGLVVSFPESCSTPSGKIKDVLEVHGKRFNPSDMGVLLELSRLYNVSLTALLHKVSPKRGRGGAVDNPEEPPVLKQAGLPGGRYRPPCDGSRRRVLIPQPLDDIYQVAALEAANLASHTGGQVLVLAPSKVCANRVVSKFSAGAVRVGDVSHVEGWKKFTQGCVQIAVGTSPAQLFSAQNLTGIVVLNDYEPGHVMKGSVQLNAVLTALLRCDAADLFFSCVSLTPTPRVCDFVDKKVHTVGSKQSGWPKVTYVDRYDFPPGSRDLPDRVRVKVEAALKNRQDVFVLAESWADVPRCAKCFTVCDSSVCGVCGSSELRVFGWPESRIREIYPAGVTPVKFSELKECVKKRGALVVVADIGPFRKVSSDEPVLRMVSMFLKLFKAAGPAGSVVFLGAGSLSDLLHRLFIERDLRNAARVQYRMAREHSFSPFRTKFVVESPKRVDTGRLSELSGVDVLGVSKIKNGFSFSLFVPPTMVDEVLELLPDKAKLSVF